MAAKTAASGGAGWRSLAPLLEALEGEPVLVELKDGREVAGLLDCVHPGDLGVTLGKARQRWLEGPRRGQVGPDLELVMLAGRRIRFVHLPDRINVDHELRRWHERKLKAAPQRQFIMDAEMLRARAGAVLTASTAASPLASASAPRSTHSPPPRAQRGDKQLEDDQGD